MTSIRACSCYHEYQDEVYGKGQRVFNARAKAKDAPQLWRCTVCQLETKGE